MGLRVVDNTQRVVDNMQRVEKCERFSAFGQTSRGGSAETSRLGPTPPYPHTEVDDYKAGGVKENSVGMLKVYVTRCRLFGCLFIRHMPTRSDYAG